MTTQTATATRRTVDELRGAASILQGCDARRVLVEGRAGTGKTAGILSKIHSWCSTYPMLRAAFIRETCVSLRSSILKTFEELVVPDGHPVLSGPSRAHRSTYHYPGTNAVIGLFGLDDPQNLFSSEWDLIYCAESTQTQKEAIELLSRSLRNFKGPYHQLILDCNPGPPTHWVNLSATKAGDDLRDADSPDQYATLQAWNDRPVDHQSKEFHRLISVHEDNPEYFDIDKWAWTPRGNIYLTGLEDMTGHRYMRMRRGRWVAAEGTVYPEFNERDHVIPPFIPPADWPVFCGMDPGYDHPCAVLWLTVAPNGTYFIFDEFYAGGKEISEIADAIHEHNADRTVLEYLGDPQHVNNHTAQSPASIAEQFLALPRPIRFGTWPRSVDVEAMVEAVRRRLKTQTLKVCSNCSNTIREFQSWSYKRTGKGELPAGDDQFEDKNNDAMDVVKGLVARAPTATRQTVKVVRSLRR